MCNEQVVVNVLRRARKSKTSDHFSVSEIEFVVKHKDLKSLDKLLWMKIACMTKDDPNLACTIDLTTIMDEPLLSVLESIGNLRKHGFLMVAWDLSQAQFENYKMLLRKMESDEPIEELPILELIKVRQLLSAHCNLLVPHKGLLAVMDGEKLSDRVVKGEINVKKNNVVEREAAMIG